MSIKNTEFRPWGSFTLFALNEKCTVKILKVKEQLSLQSHKNREEFWHVIDGKVEVLKGPVTENIDELEANLASSILTSGESIIIPKNTAHTLKNLNVKSSRVLEISYGRFDESDEIRYKDLYGRS